MKAITLWQPWASLIAVGAKKYETRSWATKYRGLLAIHASAKDPKIIFATLPTCIQNAMSPILLEHYLLWENMPCGAVIATAVLMDCHKIEVEDDGTPFYRYLPHAAEILQLQRDFPGQKDYRGQRIRRFPSSERNEILFGDWTPGRYAWELKNVQMLSCPISAKGAQGLWNWESDIDAVH